MFASFSNFAKRCTFDINARVQTINLSDAFWCILFHQEQDAQFLYWWKSSVRLSESFTMSGALESYVNRPVSVITADGRNFVGTLKVSKNNFLPRVNSSLFRALTRLSTWSWMRHMSVFTVQHRGWSRCHWIGIEHCMGGEGGGGWGESIIIGSKFFEGWVCAGVGHLFRD